MMASLDGLQGLLTAPVAPGQRAVRAVIGTVRSDSEIQQLVDLISALRLPGSTFSATQLATGPAIAVGTPSGVRGVIETVDDPCGGIQRLVLSPDVPERMDTDSLAPALHVLSCSVAVAVRDGEATVISGRAGSQAIAVSSLLKTVVFLAVCQSVRDGALSWDAAVVIRADDISVLSGGLTNADVGRSLTVTELSASMLLASDNTALDVLARVVGHHVVDRTLADVLGRDNSTTATTHFRPSGDVFREAWCPAGETETQWRQRALREVAHPRGLDYFLPLAAVDRTMVRLLEEDWTPWDAHAGGADRLLYKGGSAPGVLAASWYAHREGTPVGLSLALNLPRPLVLMEELYVYECARRCAEPMGLLRQPPDAENLAPATAGTCA